MIDRHVIGGMVIALPLRMNTTALLFVTFASNRSAQPVRETVPCGKWGSVKLYLARRMRALGCDSVTVADAAPHMLPNAAGEYVAVRESVFAVFTCGKWRTVYAPAVIDRMSEGRALAA